MSITNRETLTILELARMVCERMREVEQSISMLWRSDLPASRKHKDQSAAFGACRDHLKECIAILKGEEVTV